MMDAIAKKILAGETLDNVLIIDAHAHTDSFATVEEMLAQMDRIGIDKACISDCIGISYDCVRGNQELEKVLEAYPDRFYGYCIVNGNDPKEAARLLEKYLPMPGVIGAKLYPGEGYKQGHHNIALDDPRNDVVYDMVAEAGKCILSHTWYHGGYKAAPGKMRRGLERHPELTIIVGHSGGVREGHYETMRMMEDYPNVYFDLTGTEFGELWLRDLVQMTDTGRILYGSDLGFFDASPYIGKVGLAEIPEETKRDIFGRNMQRLLDGLRNIRR